MQNMPNNPAKLNFGINTTADDIYVQLFEGLFPANLLDMMVPSYLWRVVKVDWVVGFDVDSRRFRLTVILVNV